MFKRIKGIWCNLWHAYWHTLQQIEYGGVYYVKCKKCGCEFFYKR